MSRFDFKLVAMVLTIGSIKTATQAIATTYHSIASSRLFKRVLSIIAILFAAQDALQDKSERDRKDQQQQHRSRCRTPNIPGIEGHFVDVNADRGGQRARATARQYIDHVKDLKRINAAH